MRLRKIDKIPLTIYYQNVNSVANKINECNNNNIMSSIKYQIFALTETWLKTNVKIRENAEFLAIQMNKINLMQFNEIKNDKGNILDLVFSNIDLKIQESLDPLVKIDVKHPPLSINCDIEIKETLKIKEKIYNYKKANYNNRILEMNKINWNLILNNNNNNVDTSVEIFYNEIFKLINTYVPKTTISVSNFPSWYSYELKKSIILKKKKS